MLNGDMLNEIFMPLKELMENFADTVAERVIAKMKAEMPINRNIIYLLINVRTKFTMARTKKTPETLESFTEKCMQRPVVALIQELFETKEALAKSRNEARGLKIRKASEEIKGELKRLRAIERKYNKIIDFAKETKGK